jgi:hypothetical protein
MDSFIVFEPTPPRHTLGHINAIHADFWAKQAARQELQLTDEYLAQEAYSDLREQAELQVPLGRQRSFGALLDKAEQRLVAHRERLLPEGRRENGRRGGKARKSDALQLLIEKIVGKARAIDCPTLLQILQSKQKCGIIEEVVDEDISFTDANGRSKSIKITSLKDRLYRARKKVNSQKAVNASR